MDGRVSVIIPCYNNSRVISETLDSVINQTYDNWEVICVDDGSNDHTCQIIEAYSSQDPRILLKKREREPKGGSVCRNIGVEYSSGEFLLFLDADDLLHKDCLKNRVEKITNTQLDFVVFPFAPIRNNVIGKVSCDTKIKKHFLAFSSNHAIWQTSCPLYKASFVKKVGGFDESFPRLQDVEFGTRCLAMTNGNYKTYLKGYPADCFYRITPNKQVVTQKYDLALSTIPDLYNLILGLKKDGKYCKKDFSKVLLCLILSAVLISSSTSKKSSYKVVLPKDYKAHLIMSDRILLTFLKMTIPFGSFYYKFAHFIRYAIMHLSYV